MSTSTHSLPPDVTGNRRASSPTTDQPTTYTRRGKPTGTIIQLPGSTTISAYLSVPPLDQSSSHPSDTAILFIPDILGIWQNNQLLADRFAAATGRPVLLPDLFNGDPFKLRKPFADIEPTDDELTAWVARGSDGNNPHTTEQVDRVVAAAIDYLLGSSQHGVVVRRIGAVGYCFGAKYVVRFLGGGASMADSGGSDNGKEEKKKKKKGIDVGFLAHPSFVTEDELRASRGPLSIAAAETDLIFTVEMRRRTEEILRERKGGVWSMAVYSGVAHGFAVRGNPEGKLDRWAEEEAFSQAVRFFATWL